MTTQQQAYVLFLSDELQRGMWVPNMLQNESALRAQAAVELRRQYAHIECLQAGYDAARLEIASLQARVNECGAGAGCCAQAARIEALEAQLDAVGAGGVGALMAAPTQPATASQSPHPEYDKGFSDGWNRCEARVLMRVIQRLNQNPYSLTKSECISEIGAMRDAAIAAQPAAHVQHPDDDAVDKLAEAMKKKLAEKRASAAQAQDGGCNWSLFDEDSGAWASGCGEVWAFTDGGPQDNNVRFCQGCGKPVVITVQQGDAA